jgi:putative addiction module CopG family antidote
MNITLSRELEQRAREAIKNGRYGSIDELIEVALRQTLDDEVDGISLDELRAKIDRGLADAEAGLLFTPDEAKAMLRAKREDRLKALK